MYSTRTGTSPLSNTACPPKHVLLDNGSLGKISKSSSPGASRCGRPPLVNPDFADFTRSCGATGLTARTPGELDDAMRELFAAGGPALLHLYTDATLV